MGCASANAKGKSCLESFCLSHGADQSTQMTEICTQPWGKLEIVSCSGYLLITLLTGGQQKALVFLLVRHCRLTSR